jgi:uncharacterized glyoxalase superfamily protein PhnB
MPNPPPGYQTVSPYLLYEDAPRVIEQLKAAFGFEERCRKQVGRAAPTPSLCLVTMDSS